MKRKLVSDFLKYSRLIVKAVLEIPIHENDLLFDKCLEKCTIVVDVELIRHKLP